MGPGPPCPLLLVAEGERDLVDHVVAIALIGEGQHGNLPGRIRLIVGGDRTSRIARIGFNEAIEPGLASVRFQLVFRQEERPRPVLRARAPGEQHDRDEDQTRPAAGAASLRNQTRGGRSFRRYVRHGCAIAVRQQSKRDAT
jgi:hypothetical protein